MMTTNDLSAAGISLEVLTINRQLNITSHIRFCRGYAGGPTVFVPSSSQRGAEDVARHAVVD